MTITSVKQWSRTTLRLWQSQQRDARYIFTLFWAVLVYTITDIQAIHNGWFDSIEAPVFHFINRFPHFLYAPMYLLTQLGSLAGLIFWCGLAWYWVNRRLAYTVLASGAAGWLAAKIAKTLVHRGRPQELLHAVNVFNHVHFAGYGFPSGHATFSAACAGVLYYQVTPRYRKYILLVVFLVGISRMYLGAHFPLDVVGGWALGAGVAAIVSLIAGNSRSFISARTIKRLLNKRGYEAESVRFMQLDARGSRPLFVRDAKGNEYFCKLFGAQEYAADWLFKLYRMFRYKNLQAEEPYLNGRRNVEIESFATLWARKNGVRVPEVIDVIKMGRYWLQIQQKIDAVSLADSKRLTTASLEDAWRQVKKLHAVPVAHRDLRAANLMVERNGKVWLIDFGFAEISPGQQRLSMDTAELLMSMALIVGVKRTVAAAHKVLTRDELRRAAPYLQKSVFSGATRSQLRGHGDLLKELQQSVKDVANIRGEVTPANIQRISGRRLFNVSILAVFLYAIVPQFKQFGASLHDIDSVRLPMIALLVLASLATYMAAALVYVALSSVPLSLWRASLVQFAGSFMSKVLPGGLGGTSLNARYLTNAGLEPAKASSIIIGQGVVGGVMFIVPLAVFLLVSGQSVFGLLKFHISSHAIFAITAALLIIFAVLALFRKLRRVVQDFVAKTLLGLRELAASPRELTLAALASLAITVLYITCLYAAAHALHSSLSVGAAVLVYATAVIVKSAVPTPGGLGPLEIAMAAALVGFGVPHGQAVAITIVYRLGTFWLPIPFSLVAYRYISAKQII